MKILVTTAALLLAGAAHGQTPPAPTSVPAPAPIPPVSTLTRDLNSGPPAPAVYLAPAPAPVIGLPSASPLPAAAINPVPRPATAAGPSTSAPSAAPPAREVPAPEPNLPPSEPPVVAAPARMTPIPTTPAPQPRTVPITPGRSATPNAVPRGAEPFTPPGSVSAPATTVPLEAVVASTPAPPAAPSVTVLDNAARAALPFTVDLPQGFEIVTGRPGPDFRIYTIRRGTQSFVMVYTGPASQFPIYSGQMVEAAGRASIVSTEDGVRHAVEHLFQRPTSPSEIHVWTMSLDGADRDMAEQIAQSVDVR